MEIKIKISKSSIKRLQLTLASIVLCTILFLF